MLDSLLLLAESTNPLSAWLPTLWVILQCALALGFVIFVHELGHFAVAKWCGVRCDKFFVGFDIGGYKISRQWGETEYGIGILPLGGYVKMFGQDDNVTNIEEEIRQSEALAGSPDAKEIVGPNGEKRWVHKNSYLAKSVPQRMAIISAGVIMNVIFAFVFAWVAFGIGVPEQPCVVTAVTPGGPAWRAGLRAGDRITSVNDIPEPTYKQLQENVMLGDTKRGVTLVIERDGTEAETLTVAPDLDGPLPMIGVSPPVTVRLPGEDPVIPNGAAASVSGAGFEPGDLILEIDGAPVADYKDLLAQLMAKRSETITYTLLRGGKAPASDPFGQLQGGERVTTTVQPNPMERLGLVMTLGGVTAVQRNSPAIEAGLREGDVITAVGDVAIGAAVDGSESWDPLLLDERLSAIGARGEETTLTVQRNGETTELAISPREVTWADQALREGDPLPLSAIGVTCELQARVGAVVAGSPASKVDLLPGDRVVKATLEKLQDAAGETAEPVEIELGAETPSWPALVASIQDQSPGMEVVLDVERGGAKHTVRITPESVDDAFSFKRGLALMPLKELKTAANFSDQCQLAWEETRDALGAVFRFLKKIGGDIPVTAIGGPVTIAKVAGASAFEGFGSLLVMLTMLSANLAVLNFLPIPVLDGGHMVFLAWEGLSGRPTSERVVIALHTVGFLFLVSLMLFVTLLDVGIIPRGL